MNRTKEEILRKLDPVPDYLGVGYEQSDVLEAMEEYAKECMPKWIDVEIGEAYAHGSEVLDRTIVLFDNGEMKFYNDNDWPFAVVTKIFTLPPTE